MVGSSTGGAIDQYIAINHPEKALSLTLSSTFARFDEYANRKFKVRRKMSAEWTDRVAVYDAIALFVFSPRFKEKWVSVDIAEKRLIVKVVCLDLVFKDASLDITMSPSTPSSKGSL